MTSMKQALDEVHKLDMAQQFSLIRMTILSWYGEEGEKTRGMLKRVLESEEEKEAIRKNRDPLEHPGLTSFR